MREYRIHASESKCWWKFNCITNTVPMPRTWFCIDQWRTWLSFVCFNKSSASHRNKKLWLQCLLLLIQSFDFCRKWGKSYNNTIMWLNSSVKLKYLMRSAISASAHAQKWTQYTYMYRYVVNNSMLPSLEVDIWSDLLTSNVFTTHDSLQFWWLTNE